MGIHRAGFDDAVVPPNLLEQLFAGLNAALALGQDSKQAEFRGGEFDRLALDRDEMARNIDAELAKMENLLWLFRIFAQKISNAQEVKMANGRPALKGVCPVCGTGMFKILPPK